MSRDRQLRGALSYDPDTGDIIRLKSYYKSKEGVVVADTKSVAGYKRVRFMGKSMLQHRVAFFLMTGRWPGNIDHINGVRDDNRWFNLREATPAQNAWNRASTNVCRNGKNTGWVVRVMRHGNRVTVGTFQCYGEAIKQASNAKKEMHGEFAR